MDTNTDYGAGELSRLEELLYGWNYCVSFYLYDPLEPDQELVEILKSVISKDVEIAELAATSSDRAKAEILDMVFYEGDHACGPEELDNKRDEINSLLGKIFSMMEIDEADFITEFRFREGHPAYPVYWDFAYDVHSKKKRWIFVGSSSD